MSQEEFNQLGQVANYRHVAWPLQKHVKTTEWERPEQCFMSCHRTCSTYSKSMTNFAKQRSHGTKISMVAVVSDLDWQSSVKRPRRLEMPGGEDLHNDPSMNILLLWRYWIRILKARSIRKLRSEATRKSNAKWPAQRWVDWMVFEKDLCTYIAPPWTSPHDGCQSATLSDAKATSLFQRDSSRKTWEALRVIEHPPLKIPDSVHGPWFDVCPADQVLICAEVLSFDSGCSRLWFDRKYWNVLRCCLPWSTLATARKESVQTLTETNTLKHKRQAQKPERRFMYTCKDALKNCEDIFRQTEPWTVPSSERQHGPGCRDLIGGIQGHPNNPQTWVLRSDGCGTVLKSRWCNQTMWPCANCCSIVLKTFSSPCRCILGLAQPVMRTPYSLPSEWPQVLVDLRNCLLMSRVFHSKLQQWYPVPCICGQEARGSRGKGTMKGHGAQLMSFWCFQSKKPVNTKNLLGNTEVSQRAATEARIVDPVTHVSGNYKVGN